MSDILTHLHGLLHHVSALFMPIEVEDIAAYLRGEAWEQVSALHAADNSFPQSTCGTDASKSAMATTAATSSGPVGMTALYPLGVIMWNRSIPLGIAGANFVSVASVDSKTALAHYFTAHGFEKVLTLIFTTSTPQPMQSGGVAELHVAVQPTRQHGGAGGAVAESRKRDRASAVEEEEFMGGGSGYEGNPHEVRLKCTAVMRAWFAEVEASTTGLSSSPPQRSGLGSDATEDNFYPAKVVVHRLLLIIRCCADNRPAISSSGPSSASASAGGGARRHRIGRDTLHLCLHDVASLVQLYNVRLAATKVEARVGVLLLPEDDHYGGELLNRQLQEELGGLYHVQTFMQGRNSGAVAPRQSTRYAGGHAASPAAVLQYRSSIVSSATALKSMTERGGGLRHALTPLSRACWLASLWGVLDPSIANCGDAAKQEAALLRSSSCFFFRPGNAQLCVFLREALRRFPVLVPPAILAHWQSTWAARHSLQDVLVVFHSILCPFTMSTALHGSRAAMTALAQRSLASQQDVVDLIDLLLDAAFRLVDGSCDDAATCATDGEQFIASASERHIAESVIFMSLYEALALQRETLLFRIEEVVQLLAFFYDRAQHIHGKATTSLSPLPSSAVEMDMDDVAKARVALHTLLPYSPMNIWHQCPPEIDQVNQSDSGSILRSFKRQAALHRRLCRVALPMARISVASQLHQTLLTAIESPTQSLASLGQAAATAAQQRTTPVSAAPLSASGNTPNSSPKQPAALYQLPLAETVQSSFAPPHSIESTPGKTGAVVSPLLHSQNLYNPQLPDAVRVMSVLTRHAHRQTAGEAARRVSMVELQEVVQLSDDRLLRALKELQTIGFAATDLKTHTVRTLLDSLL